MPAMTRHVLALLAAVVQRGFGSTCCYKGNSCADPSCKAPTDWCSQSQEHCEGSCNGNFCPDGPAPPNPPGPSPPSPPTTPGPSVPLDWGKPFQSAGSDVGAWPGIQMAYGAGTDANMPALPNMLDKSLHFTLDLSAAPCHNVVAFQAVDANINDGCYCDGNSLQAKDDDPYSPGNCKGPLNQHHQPCVELDLLEANVHVWATTIHAGKVPGGWQAGDAAGRGGSRHGLSSSQYGPGSGTIDTKSPFDVKVSFPTGGSGSLHGIQITMVQNGHQVSFTAGVGADLSEATAALKRGVTPGFSYWSNNGAGMDWFDARDCSDWHGTGGVVTFSNWAISDGTGLKPFFGSNVTLLV